MRRWPYLDGVRALAALLVLVSHVGFWTGRTEQGWSGTLLARGDVGVAIFFALSAFLLAGPWLAPGGDPQGRVRLGVTVEGDRCGCVVLDGRADVGRWLPGDVGRFTVDVDLGIVAPEAADEDELTVTVQLLREGVGRFGARR